MTFDEWFGSFDATGMLPMAVIRKAWDDAIQNVANELRTAPKGDIDMHMAAAIVERMRSNDQIHGRR